MAITSVNNLVEILRANRLLKPGQLAELPHLQTHFPEARALAGELIRRGWLTPYQINLVFGGRVQELQLGPYLLLERLGAGGMGQVYKARHRLMDRVVALKVIGKEGLKQPDSVQRFHREIQAAAQLTHPNIVTAHDADLIGDTHFLVMEYVEGTDLHHLVQKTGPLPVARACDCARQAALGLQHAFERGLVHRDVKPSNLLLTMQGGIVKLLDLGLARDDRPDPSGPARTELTHTGTVVGTPDYMAPEQALDAHRADIRADIYSLGCTLYFLLAGRPPFASSSFTQKLIWHQQVEPPAVETFRPDLSPGVGAVLRKMMAKRPEDRYQTPAAAAQALAPFCQGTSEVLSFPVATPAPLARPVTPQESWSMRGESTVTYLSGPPLTGRRPSVWRKLRWWLAGGGAALVLGLLLFLLLRPGSKPNRPGPDARPPDRTQLPAEITNSAGMVFVRIKPGTFTMGSPESDANHEPHERPAHEVQISRPFYLGVHQVTRAQYQQVMGKNPSTFTAGGEDGAQLPVETVSWDEAVEFCQRLSALAAEKQAGRVYRLPTEAEWEYACRAGTQTVYSFGNDWNQLGRYAWYKDNAESKTHPVGKLTPNPWGLSDMHGNVMEWCLDGYDADYYRRSPKTDPPGAESQRKVLRGGSWLLDGRSCRSAHRDWFEQFQRSYQVGFRVLLEAPAEAKPSAAVKRLP